MPGETEELKFKIRGATKAKQEVYSLARAMKDVQTQGRRKDLQMQAKKHLGLTEKTTRATIGLQQVLSKLALPAALLLGIKNLLEGVEAVRKAGRTLGGDIARSAELGGMTEIETARKLQGMSRGLATMRQTEGAYFAAGSAVGAGPLADKIAEQAIFASALGQGDAGALAQVIGEIAKRRRAKTPEEIEAISSQLYTGAKYSKSTMKAYGLAMLDMLGVGKRAGLNDEESMAVFSVVEQYSPTTMMARPAGRAFVSRIAAPISPEAKKVLRRAGVTKEMGYMERLATLGVALKTGKIGEEGMKIVLGEEYGGVGADVLEDFKTIGIRAKGFEQARTQNIVSTRVKKKMVTDAVFRQRVVDTEKENRAEMSQVKAAEEDMGAIERYRRDITHRSREAGWGEGAAATVAFALADAIPGVGVRPPEPPQFGTRKLGKGEDPGAIGPFNPEAPPTLREEIEGTGRGAVPVVRIENTEDFKPADDVGGSRP